MNDNGAVRIPVGLRRFLYKGQKLTGGIRGSMIWPSCIVEMENISLGTIFIIHQVIAFQSETLESQHPQGVGFLHVLADKGHLEPAIDGQKAFVGPILIAL